MELKPSYYWQAQKNIAHTLEHGWTDASDQEEMFAEEDDSLVDELEVQK